MSMLSKYSVKGLMVFIYPVLKDWGLGKKKSYGGNCRLGLIGSYSHTVALGKGILELGCPGHKEASRYLKFKEVHHSHWQVNNKI